MGNYSERNLLTGLLTVHGRTPIMVYARPPTVYDAHATPTHCAQLRSRISA